MKSLVLHIIFLLLFLPGLAAAQFLNIQLDVEPEVETIVEQPLDFGQLVTNSGRQAINIGDVNMGVFKLRTLRTQQLILQLETDSELIHSDSGVQQTIPIELQASYTNNGVNDYRTSTPFGENMQDVVIEGTPENPQTTWSGMYIYVYGSIEIGNVPAGTYQGEIVLTVIYE